MQKRPENVENKLETRVVPSVEHNSKATLPNDEETGVVLPQEREDNPSKWNNERGRSLTNHMSLTNHGAMLPAQPATEKKR